MKVLKLQQVFNGISASQYFGAEGTYNSSTAVDPDLSISSSDIRTSGFCVPVGYAKFSGSNVNETVIRLITNPKNTLVYAVTTGGKLISYTSSFGSETLVGTVTGTNATWAEYYNNYIYIFGTGASKDDVSRYGPLNNSPSLVDNVWKGATLGSQTALTDTTYPSFRSVPMPNHAAHVHGDNCIYFADFKNGQGLIHKISTYKVTDEGDTNGTTVPSLYNALDLPFGFYPTAIESFGTSLMIIGNYTTDTTVIQGKAAFVLWDPTDTVSFYLGPIQLADPLASAILNVNGVIYLWTGNSVNGCRLSQYTGGEQVRDIVYQEEGLPPLAGAVDALGNRVVWGGFSTYPSTGAVVWAYGSKDSRLPQGLHNICKTSSSGANPNVTALKYVQQDSNIVPKVIPAWKNDSAYGIDKYSTSATLASKIRWMFNIGERFEIRSIKIPLAGAVDSNTTITVTLYFDDLSTSKVLTVINNTNYPSQRFVMFDGIDLKDTSAHNNCLMEIAWTGTNPLPVGLPITIGIEDNLEE
jgi:hypothetical protein